MYLNAYSKFVFIFMWKTLYILAKIIIIINWIKLDVVCDLGGKILKKTHIFLAIIWYNYTETGEYLHNILQNRFCYFVVIQKPLFDGKFRWNFSSLRYLITYYT